MNHEGQEFLRDGSIFDCHARLHEMLAGVQLTDSPCARWLPGLLDGQTTRDTTNESRGTPTGMIHNKKPLSRDDAILDCAKQLGGAEQITVQSGSPCHLLLLGKMDSRDKELFVGQISMPVTDEHLGTATEAEQAEAKQWLMQHSETYREAQKQESPRHLCDDVPCGDIALILWFISFTLVFTVVILNIWGRRK